MYKSEQFLRLYLKHAEGYKYSAITAAAAAALSDKFRELKYGFFEGLGRDHDKNKKHCGCGPQRDTNCSALSTLVYRTLSKTADYGPQHTAYEIKKQLGDAKQEHFLWSVVVVNLDTRATDLQGTFCRTALVFWADRAVLGDADLVRERRRLTALVSERAFKIKVSEEAGRGNIYMVAAKL
ncbi:hypothetical protein BV898_14659 [Hypsibius exemplaris]|uniref:Uncharacterized protein n=1 Tax=Hypsibius exemplaris TaxID=2072580 RepID=A0A9X6RJI7_HYPEX|nr:hypothetical protein BV898_14659 [Hypsibius exemplaris]